MVDQGPAAAVGLVTGAGAAWRAAAAPPAAAMARWRGAVPGAEAPGWPDAGVDAVEVTAGRMGPGLVASGWVVPLAETLLVAERRVGAEAPGPAGPGAEPARLVRVALARVDAGGAAGAGARLMARLMAAKVPRWGRPGLEGAGRNGAARAAA